MSADPKVGLIFYSVGPQYQRQTVGGMAVEVEPSHQYSITTLLPCDRW